MNKRKAKKRDKKKQEDEKQRKADEEQQKADEEQEKEDEKQQESTTENDQESNEQAEEPAKEKGALLKGVSSKLKGLGSGLKVIGSGLKDMSGGLSDIGGGIVTIGKDAIKSAQGMENAMGQFCATTGKGKEEIDRYQGVLENIYANNYGTSFDEIAAAMGEVNQKMGDMDDASLQNMTESAFILKDTFGYDISESLDAAKVLMDSLGVSGDEAMNMIAAGAQNGLIGTDGLLASVSACPEQFAGFADGAAGATDAMGMLKEVKCDDLDSMLGSLKNSVEMLLLPIGEGLIPLFKDVLLAIMPIVQEVLPPFIDLIVDLIAQSAPLIAMILPMLVDLFISLMPPLMELVRQLFPILIWLFEQLMPPIIEIIGAILPVFIGLLNVLLPIFAMLIDKLLPVIDLFIGLIVPIVDLIGQALIPLVTAIGPIIDIIAKFLIPIIEVLATIFAEVFSGIVKDVKVQIGIITDIFNSIIDFVKNVFTGNWEGAWENIKEIFGSIAEGIGESFKRPINFIIDLINGFIKGVNKIKIPNWVPGIGGTCLNIPTIPRLRVGIDYVPTDDFPALLHKGEAVLTAQENALYQTLGGFHGMMRSFSPNAKSNRVYVAMEGGNEPMSFDYGKMGEATAQALERAGLTIQIGEREFGRVVREAIR